MPDIADTITEAVEKGRESRLNTVVAILVSVAASFMALCSVKGSNVVQAMQQAQSSGLDAWAHYQAESTKQHVSMQMIDALTVQRDGFDTTPFESRSIYERKIIDYTAKSTLDGDDQEKIKKSAEAFEKRYEELGVHDDQFDMAEASLSVSIAFFGMTALTRKRWLLLVAGFFVVWGFVFGFAGFFGSRFHPDFLARLLG
jgi:hypothetical protein